jgi:osmotically inducible protein OsmC
MKKTATAIWQGNLKEGGGTISTESGQLSYVPYGFNTRFGEQKGANPEELLGAAHAACFSMALSVELEKQKLIADSIETKAEVSLEKKEDGWYIPAIHLAVSAIIPGATQAQLTEAAEKTKTGCPVSKVLNANITMEATLKNT